MGRNAEIFKNYLDTKDIKYTYYPAEEGRTEAVKVGFSCKNVESVRVMFFFDEGNDSVNVKSFSIAKVPTEKMMNLYVVLNELNKEYRWVKFYIDSDNEVTVSGDAIISSETAGEECAEILFRYVNIIDEVYPRIMKGLWA